MLRRTKEHLQDAPLGGFCSKKPPRQNRTLPFVPLGIRCQRPVDRADDIPRSSNASKGNERVLMQAESHFTLEMLSMAVLQPYEHI